MEGGIYILSKKSYSFRSLLFSGIGILLFILSYLIAPDVPEGFMYFLINTIFISSLTLFFIGIISSILAIKKKEQGKMKYVGLLIPLLLIIYIILIPMLMGILFILNDP